MNPDTHRLEKLTPAPAGAETDLRQQLGATTGLLRPTGEPVPRHWVQFQEGEHVVVKDCTLRVKAIGETYILLEPAAVTLVGAAQAGAAGV